MPRKGKKMFNTRTTLLRLSSVALIASSGLLYWWSTASATTETFSATNFTKVINWNMENITAGTGIQFFTFTTGSDPGRNFNPLYVFDGTMPFVVTDFTFAGHPPSTGTAFASCKWTRSDLSANDLSTLLNQRI